MRLRQLKALVLPAPLGPMSASSSARSTVNDRSSSTVRPPKRRLRPSTSSSAIPPPAAAVLLHVAIAAARAAASLAQIELLDVGMTAQPSAVAVEHNAAVLQDVAVVGDSERNGGALLHQHHGKPELALDLNEPGHEVVHDDRRQPQGQLVHQQQLRPTHQRGG